MSWSTSSMGVVGSGIAATDVLGSLRRGRMGWCKLLVLAGGGGLGESCAAGWETAEVKSEFDTLFDRCTGFGLIGGGFVLTGDINTVSFSFSTSSVEPGWPPSLVPLPEPAAPSNTFSVTVLGPSASLCGTAASWTGCAADD